MRNQPWKTCDANTDYNVYELQNELLEVIQKGQISNLFKIDSLLKDIEHPSQIDSRINLLLVYIFFVLLNSEERCLFTFIQRYVFRYLGEYINLYTNNDSVENIFEAEYKNLLIEEQYLYSLSVEILYNYTGKNFKEVNIPHFDSTKINILISSLFNSGFNKFNDMVLIAFMIWKSKYNYEGFDVSEHAKDLLNTIVQNQARGIIINLTQDSVEENTDQEDNNNYASQFYQMKLQ